MKYIFNETFFDKLNHLSVYWLGFIAADGCIVDQKYENKEVYGRNVYIRKYLKLRIAEKDINHLEQFVKDMDGNHKPYRYETSNSIQYGVHFNSEHLVKTLINYGITPAKSLTLKMPILPSELERHFFRGYFDGDGSSGCYEGKWRISVVGTENILNAFGKHLSANCDIPIPKLYCPKIDAKYREIKLGGNLQVPKILRYLRNENERCLSRKYHLL